MLSVNTYFFKRGPSLLDFHLSKINLANDVAKSKNILSHRNQ